MNPIRSLILARLEKDLSPQRLRHCLGVEETAVQLASRFQVDPEDASAAALLHDLCRETSPDLLLKLAAKFDIVVDSIQTAEPLLLHGLVASKLAEAELDVANPNVLEAVAYHITGGPGISALAQLIFIADFIEPGRTYEEAHRLRSLAHSLDPGKLLLEVYNCTISFVLRKNYLIHPLSVNGRNELLLKGCTLNGKIGERRS